MQTRRRALVTDDWPGAGQGAPIVAAALVLIGTTGFALAVGAFVRWWEARCPSG